MSILYFGYSIGFLCAVVAIGIIGYFWFYRFRIMIDRYLKVLCELFECTPIRRIRILPFYSKTEVVGKYAGRQIIGGVQYIGVGLEWMPVPIIKIKLKQVIRYNYHRLPHFAYIERGWLVLRVKEHLYWGVFDKGYPRFFEKEYIVITLARLMAVAEDVERGKTLEEIFK